MEKHLGLLEEELYKELSTHLLEALRLTLTKVKDSNKNKGFIKEINNVIDKAEQILK